MNILILSSFSLKTYEIETLERCFSKDLIHLTPWVLNLVDGLIQNHKNSVTLVGWTRRIKRDYEIRQGNLRILLLKSPKPSLQLLSRFNVNIKQLKAKINIKNIDIVHSQEINRLSIIASKLNIPWLVTNHGMIADAFKGLERNKLFDKQYLPYLITERICFRKLKFMICVSPYVQKQIKYNIATFQIDNAISKEFFVNKSYLINNNILFVGSMTIRKQLDVIIKALEYVPSANLKIIYQYYDDDYMKSIQVLVKEKKMGHRVDFLGPKSQMQIIDELKDSTLLIVPSRWESFGMVFAEAMAMGVPAIGTNVAGIPHVIKDGYNGFLINVGDYKTLSEKINYLFNNRDKLGEMGNNAFKTARERWHPDIIAEKTLNVYNTIIKNAD